MTEREQVIAELLYLKHDCLEGSATDQTLDKALALLKAQEPNRKGQWIKDADRYNHWHCSECGFTDGIHAMICKYCPACGAKMEDKS